MLCALIMAGGKGTRFWPLSTEEKPKQFLNLIGNETMIQMTVNRVKPLIPIERIFICTGEQYVSLVKEQLPELPEKNIIVEPEGRNTAPCIALSAFVIRRYYKDATMVVLPSDHLIKEEEKFLNIIKDAGELLSDYQDAIITLGMTPDRPETGYGYIKSGNEHIKINNNKVITVESFVEKPNKEKAEEYLREGNYLWNGGMFLWKVDNVLKLIDAHLPNTYEALKNIELVKEDQLQDEVNNNYGKTDSISVDYGIMEKAESIHVIPTDIGWDDIGTWNAVERYRKKDENSNIHIGEVNIFNGTNNLVVASSNNIIIDELSDIYVIENNGKIIIGKKENVDRIKSLKDIVL
ncbi:mannose-1-phosphate guanylyltransferase [Clostridium polyendosporum]|uniref:mannose-1-phosphate guanylyltransferase n=1 Tax=Clostridium polyendosporum TaxID=69208 RepID=A0A919S1X1_9CLOT|nr:mannose-1-phosphate guanylyltransferase [Clostridium polyendosporum]GIM30262.1 mannose-1-phosphate guanylyltransferase [Clostridium polyendosporum]